MRRRRRNDAPAAGPGASPPACRSAATPCSPARRSTSPKTGRCCTRRCAHRAAQSCMLDGEDVIADVHAVLDAMARVRRRRALRQGGRRDRQEDHRHRQHRHRRLRSRPGHGDAGAGALARRPARALRLQCRRRAYPRHAEGARPRDHALHHRLEDLHHGRDHDQRRNGAEMDRGRARQGRRRPSISPPSPPRSTRSRNSASRRTASSASGTGSAAAIRSGAPSACRS